MSVLVTGGTGNLGRELVPRLLSSGHDVRILSRQADPARPAGVDAVRGDLVDGTGLAEAVTGADTIVHCASGTGTVRGLTYASARRTDVDATARLVEAARRAGSPHVVYISIVGVDRIPLGYYRAKKETEAVITASGLPVTILRTTQWHTLLWELCGRLSRGPVAVVPRGFWFQLLDPREAADRLTALVAAGPSGRVPDMGGPEILPIEEIVRGYLEAAGKRRPVVRAWLPGGAARAMRAGHNLTPDHADGTVTWRAWLDQADGGRTGSRM